MISPGVMTKPLASNSLSTGFVGLDPTAASGIGVRTVDADQAEQIGLALEEQLGGYPYVVESWIVRNRALFSALQLEKIALGVIVFLIVLVAAFNIVTSRRMLKIESDRCIMRLISTHRDVSFSHEQEAFTNNVAMGKQFHHLVIREQPNLIYHRVYELL